MPTLIILIGASGSGKSTLSRKLIAEVEGSAIVASADHGMMEEGVYRFAPEKLPAAHSAARHTARRAMEQGVRLVIVDNTNTSIPDMFPYVSLAESFRYQIRFLVLPEIDPEVLTARNLHSVPLKEIVSQRDRIRHTLSHWPQSWPPFERVS